MVVLRRLRSFAALFVLPASVIAAGCSGGDVMRAAGDVELVSELPAITPPAVELKKVVPETPVPPWAPKDPTWTYVLSVDYGIRSDDGGKGNFLAPRSHGRHNGVDFLAPVGTPLLAACSGRARSLRRGGYGNVVQLVCKLPDHLGGDEGLHASLFYAHLSRSAVPEQWTATKAGTKIGAVGKTGNASGPKIKPHLHFEIVVRESERAAKDEKHSGLDAKGKAATDLFLEKLEEECLEPAKFQPHAGLRRERRPDPYVVLTCAAKPKPDLAEPTSSELREAQVKWSAHYTAKGFDVDRGPR